MAITFYFLQISLKEPFIKSMIALFDMLLLVYAIIDISKIAALIISVQNIAAFAEISNLKLKNASFLEVLKNNGVSNGKLAKRLQMVYKFNAYYREHSAAYARSVLTNKALVSPILGVTLVANLACSVYIVSILQYRSVGGWEVTGLLGILSMQVIFTLVPVLCCIQLCKALYWIEKYVICVQLKMEQQHFYLKLKLNNFYELIHSENRFTFTVGSFGKITTKSLLEVMKKF